MTVRLMKMIIGNKMVKKKKTVGTMVLIVMMNLKIVLILLMVKSMVKMNTILSLTYRTQIMTVRLMKMITGNNKVKIVGPQMRMIGHMKLK